MSTSQVRQPANTRKWYSYEYRDHTPPETNGERYWENRANEYLKQWNWTLDRLKAMKSKYKALLNKQTINVSNKKAKQLKFNKLTSRTRAICTK